MTFKLTAPRKQNMTPELGVRNVICSWLQMQETKGIAWGSVVNSVGIYDQAKKVYRKSNSPYIKKGVPDWQGCWRGRSLLIEFKSPELRDASSKLIRRKGSLSQDQREYLTKAHAAKSIVIVAFGLEDVLRNLRLVDEQMGLQWQGHMHPPTPKDPTRQGMVMINGQFAGFADSVEDLKTVMESQPEPQTDITDFIKSPKS